MPRTVQQEVLQAQSRAPSAAMKDGSCGCGLTEEAMEMLEQPFPDGLYSTVKTYAGPALEILQSMSRACTSADAEGGIPHEGRVQYEKKAAEKTKCYHNACFPIPLDRN